MAPSGKKSPELRSVLKAIDGFDEDENKDNVNYILLNMKLAQLR